MQKVIAPCELGQMTSSCDHDHEHSYAIKGAESVGWKSRVVSRSPSSSYVGLCLPLIRFLTNRLVHKAIPVGQQGAQKQVQHWLKAFRRGFLTDGTKRLHFALHFKKKLINIVE